MERFADELDLTQYRMDQEIEFAIAANRSQACLAVGRETCIDCGAGIPPQRLAQVPYATRCLTCQERLERQGTRRRTG